MSRLGGSARSLCCEQVASAGVGIYAQYSSPPLPDAPGLVLRGSRSERPFASSLNRRTISVVLRVNLGDFPQGAVRRQAILLGLWP